MSNFTVSIKRPIICIKISTELNELFYKDIEQTHLAKLIKKYKTIREAIENETYQLIKDVVIRREIKDAIFNNVRAHLPKYTRQIHVEFIDEQLQEVIKLFETKCKINDELNRKKIKEYTDTKITCPECDMENIGLRNLSRHKLTAKHILGVEKKL